MKQYILVKDSVPLGFAMAGVAHASLGGYLQFKDTAEVKEWLSGPFNVAVCKVTAAEFEKAKLVPDNVVITESRLGGAETCLVFRPRAEWPKAFKFFPLYGA
jgi:hypothetical protein